MRGMSSRGRRLGAAGFGALLLCALLAAAACASSTVPPTIVITSPRDGESVSEPTVTLAGKVTVAPVDGPSPRVTATLNGKPLRLDVAGRVAYEFRSEVRLKKGSNELTVAVNDGNGGESSKTVTVAYEPVLPTKRQCVADKQGDSHDRLTHMDIVQACATRRGAKVVFSVTTAKPPPHVHDGFGNPAAPCVEIPRAPPGHGGPAPIQTCGDARLRGYTVRNWPRVPFAIHGRVSTWKVPLKYLPQGSFEWRAYVSDADHYRDKAPDKGFLSFAVR
jgi:hypothetical protein